MVKCLNQIFNKIKWKTETETTSEDEGNVTYGLGQRHIQAFILFVCLLIGFITSGHISMTIVAMSLPENDTDTRTDSRLNWNLEKTHDIVRYVNIYQTYDWPKSTHEIIMGSYFLGIAIMMLPIGLIGQRFGGKFMLQLTMGVNAVMSFITPWCVAWGDWIALSVLRFFQGGVQSGLYPGIQLLNAHWIPISERNSLSSFIYAGSGIGSMMAFLIAGVLADSQFGWPATFWVVGVLCFIALVLLTFFGVTTPNDHKSISEKEKNYIAQDRVEEVVTKSKLPWKKILTSIPLWATVIAHVGNTVSFLFFFMQGPSYMVGVLDFDIMSSGFLTALPYLCSCISALVFGNLSDYLTNRKIISIKTSRKIFNSIASVIPAICLTIVAFTNSSVLAVVCFVLFSTANSGHHTGWMVNYMDLSPNYCGGIMSIGNIIGGFFSVLLPIITSYVVTDVRNRYQWRILILLVAGFLFVSNAIFLIFMSADIQPWNKGVEEEEDEDIVKKA